jgi:hypothetical protein
MSASATKPAKKRVPRKVSDEPSAASLREIPELSPDAPSLGRGPEGMRMAQGFSYAVRRGRPPKGETAAGTSTRSVRLPGPEWAALDWVCEQLETSPHAAMREAIVQWLARAGGKLKAKEKAPAKPAAKSKPAKRAQG